jgi:ethanolamine utilization cobalamin adenosyltransferase
MKDIYPSQYSFSAMEFIKTKKVKLVIVEEQQQEEHQEQQQERQPKSKRVRFWDMCYHYVAVANDELVEYEAPLEFSESNEKFPLLL